MQGTYEHIVAFSTNWVAQPCIKLYEDSSVVVSLSPPPPTFSCPCFQTHAPSDVVWRAWVAGYLDRGHQSILTHHSPYSYRISRSRSLIGSTALWI
jgi:hypothetical protein